MKTESEKTAWDNTAKALKGGQEFDELLAEQYRKVHLDLIYGWRGDIAGLKILKTDLFAEGLCPSRSFLWDLLSQDVEVTGIDISPQIVKLTASNLPRYSSNRQVSLMTGDVRSTGFADSSFDLVVSDSTLDHFRTYNEISLALKELARVLKPGGMLIITLDNKSNITNPLFELWKGLRLSPFYIGKTLTLKQLRAEIEKNSMKVLDSTAIVHYPRFFTKAIISLCRKLYGHKMDSSLRKWIQDMDRRENSRTKYLTAQFIAVKAVKA